MALEELLAKVRQTKAEESNSALQIYAATVAAVASGKDLTPDEILPALGDAGKSTEDFEKDVHRLLNRRAWKAAVDSEPALQKQADELGKTIQNERERFNQARRDHDHLMIDLNGQMHVLHGKLNCCADARTHLANTADNEMTKKLRLHVSEGIIPLQGQLRGLEGQLTDLTNVTMRGVEKDSSEFADMKKQADGLRTEIAGLKKKIDRMHAQTEQIQEQALQP